jgi:hypothetical protein
MDKGFVMIFGTQKREIQFAERRRFSYRGGWEPRASTLSRIIL